MCYIGTKDVQKSVKSMKILSYVGGHDVVIYQNAVYDPSIRKYRGGTPAAVIPYSGRMLSATAKPAREEMVLLNGVEIPVHAASEWDHVDSLPAAEECDFALVSALYAAVCQKLGLDTSRLLTIGGVVVDDAGHTVGCVWLNPVG